MIFSVSEKDMLDANIIKIFDGIAGSGKSTTVVNFLKDYGFKYFCPTNRLAKSSSERFGIKAATMASGLFKTVKGRFYAEMKPMEGENLIIDELLLLDPHVWEYVKTYHNNYIFLTDSCQMLPPKVDTIKVMKKELATKRYVYCRIKETKRARDAITKAHYEYWYKRAMAGDIVYLDDIKKMYPTIDISAMKYSQEAVYIVHTNREEKRLYTLFRNDFLQKLPKAFAAKEEDQDKIDKLPYLCQEDAKRLKANNYAQVANIATPTRFQGCETDGVIYYIVSSKSKITACEMYTTITRIKDISNFVVVVDDASEDDFAFFRGKQVKKEGVVTMKKEEIDFIEKMGGSVKVNVAAKASIKNRASRDFHFSPDKYFVNGDKQMHDFKAHPAEDQEEDKKRHMSCKGLLTKEDGVTIGLENIKKIYRILEKRGVDHMQRPTLRASGVKQSCTHNFDFYSAFPHILYYEKFPVDSQVNTTYSSDNLNYYINVDCGMLNAGCVVTEDVVARLGYEHFSFLFGLGYKVGTDMGKKLLEKSLRSIDSKKSVKEIKWGFTLKRFLTPTTEKYKVPERKNGLIVRDVEVKKDIYVINELCCYEPFGIALYSHEVALVLDMIKSIASPDFYVVADGLFYSADTDMDKRIIEYIEKTPYRGRIWGGHYDKKSFVKDNMIWKNYEELTTRRKKIVL